MLVEPKDLYHLNASCSMQMIIEMSKGRQFTLPAEIRDALNLSSGSKLEVVLKKGEVVLKPVGDDLHLMFEEAKRKKPKRTLTAKQMDQLNEALFR